MLWELGDYEQAKSALELVVAREDTQTDVLLQCWGYFHRVVLLTRRDEKGNLLESPEESLALHQSLTDIIVQRGQTEACPSSRLLLFLTHLQRAQAMEQVPSSQPLHALSSDDDLCWRIVAGLTDEGGRLRGKGASPGRRSCNLSTS